ncbi:MAG: hypothetical protein AABM66_13215 [Actinomycetota bacterium]
MNAWVWTWGGTSFGFLDGDALFTHDGRHVGFLDLDGGHLLIFAVADGRYLGEVKDGDRLITKHSRLNRRRSRRARRTNRMARMRRMNRMPRMMRIGYEEFPAPEHL